MSEYQCYEFGALERPLTPKQMEELRRISKRAEISPTRFWNEYQWGDLKADARKLMERYFDAHLYFANWGARRLMLRFPLARIDASALRPYFAGGAASSRRTAKHLIVDLHIGHEDGGDDEGEEASLAELAPLRAEVMQGDRRFAYLAWLLAVQSGDVGERSLEPAVPRGLAELTPAQDAMAGFLRIDDDLIATAAVGSGETSDERASLAKWAMALAPRAKDEWLRRAIDAPDLALGGEMLREFRARPVRAAQTKLASRRTVAELLAAAGTRRDQRVRAQAARTEKAKRAAEAARTKQLDGLAKRLDEAWKELEALVARSAHEEALELAGDLSDLDARDRGADSFKVRFAAMRKRQGGRRGFFERWNRECARRATMSPR